MRELQQIVRISDAQQIASAEGSVVAMVGSFAPVHQGHFDAINAASSALVARGVQVESLVLTPNSAQYVENKIPEYGEVWTYEKRVEAILQSRPNFTYPSFVDDLSGPAAERIQINDFALFSIEKFLGFMAAKTYLVVGSDQILSMESHLSDKNNRAVCVLRPNNLDNLGTKLKTSWVADAIDSGRFIVTERENMEYDISSTKVREAGTEVVDTA